MVQGAYEILLCSFSGLLHFFPSTSALNYLSVYKRQITVDSTTQLELVVYTHFLYEKAVREKTREKSVNRIYNWEQGWEVQDLSALIVAFVCLLLTGTELLSPSAISWCSLTSTLQDSVGGKHRGVKARKPESLRATLEAAYGTLHTAVNLWYWVF